MDPTEPMLASKDYSSWRTIWTAETKHRAAGLPRRVSSAAASPRIVPVAAVKASTDHRVHPCLVLPLLRPSREERKPTSSKGAAGRKGRRRRAKGRRALMLWTNGWRWIKKRGELHCSIMLQTKKAPLPQSGKKERPPQRQIEKRYLEQQNPTSTRNNPSLTVHDDSERGLVHCTPVVFHRDADADEVPDGFRLRTPKVISPPYPPELQVVMLSR